MKTEDKTSALFVATAFDVVAVACSAGGLEALNVILSTLPLTFPATIVVVQHLSPDKPSLLASILSRRTALSVTSAQEGERLQAGHVYLAVPDCHLLVTAQATLSLSDAAKVHFTRPAADPLFLSVAARFHERAIGIVLTGANGDGADGIRAIKNAGGVTIAQDAATSDHFSMPHSAINTGKVDYVLSLDEIASTLMALVRV